MKIHVSILLLGTLIMLIGITASDQTADEEAINRRVRQANAEEMVENILQWLQGVYKKNRKVRQGVTSYLPPGGQNAERPRPFQLPSSTSRPPYNPSSNYDTSTQFQPSGNPTYTSSFGSSFSTSNAPSSQSYPDYSQSGYPATGSISPQPPFDSSPPEYVPITSSTPNYNTGSGTYQSGSPTYTQDTSTPRPYRPQSSPFQPETSSYQPSYPSSPSDTSYRPSTPDTSGYQTIPTSPPSSYPPPSSPQGPTLRPTYRPSSTPGYQPSTSSPFPDDDDNHPPHIHALDVQCAKDMMTINIEFNRPYNGIVYSKGFYNDPNCIYVRENSNQVKYSFTLSLNSCGTEFINGFDTQGQSYLENVLVFQNEVGIQEVWDSIRSVRCLWEGNLNKQLSIALSVGMLNQEVVTFSGDTAMASLDIQLGRGPFAAPANGLVKIGETMTLVVSITGDPGFDIQVRDCRARDSSSRNVVALTDANGCVLKPKVFGAFQKTRNTGNTGSSIIAYAFFNAFKFPDIMDLILECNVELCKTNCEMCPDPNQKFEPGRRRRRDTLHSGNDTLTEPVTVGKSLRVILPEDIAFSEPIGICLSYSGFLWGAIFVLSIMMISSISAGFMWIKLQRNTKCKTNM